MVQFLLLFNIFVDFSFSKEKTFLFFFIILPIQNRNLYVVLFNIYLLIMVDFCWIVAVVMAFARCY